MFSVIKELFLKAESDIKEALNNLTTQEKLIEEAKEYSGDFSSQINNISSKLTAIKGVLKKENEKVIQAKESITELNNTNNLNNSAFSDNDNLENITLNLDIFNENNENQNINNQTEISDIPSLSEYNELINECEFLSSEDKELSNSLYEKGNYRSATLVVLRSELEGEKKSKEEELARLEEELNEAEFKNYEDPDFSRYRNLSILFQGLDENDSDYEYLYPEYSKLKEKFENKELNEEISYLEYEIQAIDNQIREYNISINEFKYDYLDYDINYLNYEVNVEIIADLLALCKDYYEIFEGLTYQEFLDICQAHSINPSEINMLLFYQELINSDWFLEKNKNTFFDNFLLSTEFNNINSLYARAFLYLSPEEIKKYNYLYETEGISAANEYLYDLEDSINNIQGIEIAKEIIQELNQEGQASRLWQAFEEGGRTGIITWINNTSTFFNGNTTTTSREYASMYVNQVLLAAAALSEISEDELDSLYKSGEIDEKVYNQLIDKDGKIANYDLLYVNGQISEDEYLSYQQLSASDLITNPECQNLISLIGDSTILGKEEGKVLTFLYEAGNTTGNMLPSIAMSAIFSGIDPSLAKILSQATIGLSSYGKTYKKIINSGYNEEIAVIYSLLSVGGELGLNYAISGIRGLARGSDFIDTGLDITQVNNYLEIITYTLKESGKNILKETNNKLVKSIYDKTLEVVVLGKTDLSNFDEELAKTAMITAISTFILNLGSDTISLTKNIYEYNNYQKTLSFKIDDDNYINYTPEDFKNFTDSNGNIDYQKLENEVNTRIVSSNTTGSNASINRVKAFINQASTLRKTAYTLGQKASKTQAGKGLKKAVQTAEKSIAKSIATDTTDDIIDAITPKI